MTTDTTIAIWAEATTPVGEIIMGNTATESGLPWPHNRDDLEHFRTATRNRVLVMGRNTFEKLPASMKTVASTFERPLMILTTTRPLLGIDIEAYWHAGTFESPQDMHRFLRAVYPDKGIAVIGGPTVIEWAEPVIDRILLTYFHAGYEGDVRAPSDEFVSNFGVERVLGNTGAIRITQYDRDVPTTESKELQAA